MKDKIITFGILGFTIISPIIQITNFYILPSIRYNDIINKINKIDNKLDNKLENIQKKDYK
jgi:hypothetical protein